MKSIVALLLISVSAAAVVPAVPGTGKNEADPNNQQLQTGRHYTDGSKEAGNLSEVHVTPKEISTSILQEKKFENGAHYKHFASEAIYNSEGTDKKDLEYITKDLNSQFRDTVLECEQKATGVKEDTEK